MAITTTNSGSYRTVYTETERELQVTVTTDTDDKGITYVRVTVARANGDASTYDETVKRTAHSAIASAVKNKINSCI